MLIAGDAPIGKPVMPLGRVMVPLGSKGSFMTLLTLPLYPPLALGTAHR